MIGGLNCRGWAMVSYSSLADLKKNLKKWKMKLAWKHFYVKFKVQLISLPDIENCLPPHFLILIPQHSNENILVVGKEGVSLKNPFHSSPWPWLELFGKSEHEEDILSAILDGWIGLDVEVVGDVEADDQTDDLLLLSTRLSCWHIVPENNCFHEEEICFRIYLAIPEVSGCSGQPSGMQGWANSGSCNVCGDNPSLHCHPQLVKQTLISWQICQNFFSYWLDFARHRVELDNRKQPNIFDNALSNRTSPCVWSTSWSVQLGLKSMQFTIARIKENLPAGASEKAH